VCLRQCVLSDLFTSIRGAADDSLRIGRGDGVGAARTPHCDRGSVGHSLRFSIFGES